MKSTDISKQQSKLISKMAMLDAKSLSLACSKSDKSVIVLGDLMLDAYVEGEISRISPEAPVPVLSKPSKEKYVIGGAGNVANNLVSFGNDVILISGVGSENSEIDESGKILLDLISKSGMTNDYIVKLDRQTTKKKRIISGNQQILRIDSEDTFSISEKEEDLLIKSFENAIEKAGLIIISDYAKGLITKRLVQHIEAISEKFNLPILVDTKLKNLSIFSKPSLIKPNLKEAQEFTGISFTGDLCQIEEMSNALRDKFSCDVLITCGRFGMILNDGQELNHIAAREKPVFDVSGAGDTVLASLGHCLLRDLTLTDAASFSSVAAGIAITKKGTATVNLAEIKTDLDKVIIPKVWGHEEWIVNAEYCGKKLVLKEGYCCSLHYHKIKDETFYIASGKVGFQLGDEHFILMPGDSLLLRPGAKHRFYGLEHSEIFEFSTHHMEDDSYRDEESGTFDKSFFDNVPLYQSR